MPAAGCQDHHKPYFLSSARESNNEVCKMLILDINGDEGLARQPSRGLDTGRQRPQSVERDDGVSQHRLLEDHHR